MNAGELIEFLRRLPPETEVRHHDDSGHAPIEAALIEHEPGAVIL
ncbi:hypothetical protein [Gordonia rubripertincta]|nr:hypothetical protein [Gordonia rubripertincta]